MDKNILGLYPLLIDHLSGVAGVKAVFDAAKLSELLNSSGKGRTTAPVEKAVYLVFDYARPVSSANNKSQHKVAVGFTAYFVERYYPNSGLNLTQTGEILTRIMSAVSGFDPKSDDGDYFVATPFALRDAPAVEYNDGFALFPVSFECSVVV